MTQEVKGISPEQIFKFTTFLTTGEYNFTPQEVEVLKNTQSGKILSLWDVNGVEFPKNSLLSLKAFKSKMFWVSDWCMVQEKRHGTSSVYVHPVFSDVDEDSLEKVMYILQHREISIPEFFVMCRKGYTNVCRYLLNNSYLDVSTILDRISESEIFLACISQEIVDLILDRNKTRILNGINIHTLFRNNIYAQVEHALNRWYVHDASQVHLFFHKNFHSVALGGNIRIILGLYSRHILGRAMNVFYAAVFYQEILRGKIPSKILNLMLNKLGFYPLKCDMQECILMCSKLTLPPFLYRKYVNILKSSMHMCL